MEIKDILSELITVATNTLNERGGPENFDLEDFIKSMGYTIKEVRKHYMKGTDITLYVLDYALFNSLKKNKSNEQL